MKILSGRELSGYVKERQAHEVRSLAKKPTLAILRDNDEPVISKYVSLKNKYGDDIDVNVIDYVGVDIAEKIQEYNNATNVDGIIVQLPLKNSKNPDEILNLINPEKDVDGLGEKSEFYSATAEAINWLLAGFDVDLKNKKIAVVGKGRLVGAPLIKMWQKSGLDVQGFEEGDSLDGLNEYDVLVSATGVARLIKTEMVKTGAAVVDAGTTSENGVLVGDVDDAVRGRKDLTAITPKIGGVGPLTITCLFEHVLQAARRL